MLSRQFQRNIVKALPSVRPALVKQASKTVPFALRHFSETAGHRNATVAETVTPSEGMKSWMIPTILS